MTDVKWPDNSTIHTIGDSYAITIPADGFEKMIKFVGPGGKTWIHKDFQKKSKKRKKRA